MLGGARESGAETSRSSGGGETGMDKRNMSTTESTLLVTGGV